MRDPEAILDAFKTRSDDAARRVAELRQARDKALQDQVTTLRSIETAFNDGQGGGAVSRAASTYARVALRQASMLRAAAEKLSEHEAEARDILLDRFSDQKRFELFLSQRQLKERQVERRREEKALLEQIDQLSSTVVLDEDEE